MGATWPIGCFSVRIFFFHDLLPIIKKVCKEIMCSAFLVKHKLCKKALGYFFPAYFHQPGRKKLIEGKSENTSLSLQPCHQYCWSMNICHWDFSCLKSEYFEELQVWENALFSDIFSHVVVAKPLWPVRKKMCEIAKCTLAYAGSLSSSIVRETNPERDQGCLPGFIFCYSSRHS